MPDPSYTLTRRRRFSLAYTPAERDGLLRWAYLERYEDDAEFGGELLAVYTKHAVPLAPLPDEPLGWWLGAQSERDDVRALSGVDERIVAYVAAVNALCRRYGLHRLHLPPERRGELAVGAALVHEFSRWRSICAEQGREHGPDDFAQGYDGGGAVPDLSEGPWDPRHETYGAAVDRLGWRRAGDLRTIAKRAEVAGLLFLDGHPEMQRDLGWLYRHVARGDTYRQIAATDLPPSVEADPVEMVRQAVKRMARRVFRSA